MFKLNRSRSTDRAGERFEFQFSSFRALQVPKGWDRLCICIITAENSRSVAKSTKATNRNGICQWPDSILEPIWIPQDDVTKEPEVCSVKIILTMGSAKTGILGESTVNLTDYLSSADSTPLSLTLNKCSYGTILQLKLQCISAKSQSPTNREELSANSDDLDSKSDGSDSAHNRNAGSFQDTSFSAPGSHRNSNSGENLVSPKNNALGNLHMGRQDSAGSSSSPTSASRGDDISRSNNSSFSSRTSGSSLQHGNTQAVINGLAQLSIGTSNSSKDLLEAAEETIEELRDEAKMWERHSRKLKVDLETLKKECSDKSKHCTELENELSAAQADRDSFKYEIEKLKSSMENLTLSQTKENSPGSEGMITKHQDLEDEVNYLKVSNADLASQLKKSQDANVELVSILQELEETVEAQRLEVAKLSEENNSGMKVTLENERELARQLSLKEEEIKKLNEKLSRASDLKYDNSVDPDKSFLDLEKENEDLRAKILELEKDCAELTEENLEFIYKLKDAGVVIEGLDSKDSGNYASEIGTLSLRIQELEQELSDMELGQKGSVAKASTDVVQKLESKCANLESELENFRSEVFDLERKLQESLEELEEKNHELVELKGQIESFHGLELRDGSMHHTRGSGYSETADQEDLENETGAEEVIANIQLMEQEIDELKQSKMEVENLLSEFQKEKSRLEESLASAQKEGSDAQNDLVSVGSGIESQVSANKTPERKAEELQNCKLELETHIFELEKENEQLAMLISELEDHLAFVLDDGDSNEMKLENSRPFIQDLKATSERKGVEMKTHKLDMKRQFLEAQKRSSEAFEEYELLRRSNYKLQVTIQDLGEEINSLQAQNAELTKQNLELLDQFTFLEVELNNSQERNSGFSKKIEVLEGEILSLQKEISVKEQSFLTELESIIQEHKEHEVKINHANVLLNKMETDKIAEVENLEREISSLTAQMSSTDDDRGKATLDAIHEASILRGDKIRLQNELDGLKFEKGKIEKLLQQVSQESEELMTEMVLLRSQVSSLQEKIGCLEVEKSELAMKFQLVEEELSSKKLLAEGHKGLSEGTLDNDADLQPKVHLLEIKLAQALQEKKMYEVQLKRSSEMHDSGDPSNAGVNKKVENDRIASLEAEVRDLKERLLNTSLQYAEVEAQREELVMQLKATKKDKKWFA